MAILPAIEVTLMMPAATLSHVWDQGLYASQCAKVVGLHDLSKKCEWKLFYRPPSAEARIVHKHVNVIMLAEQATHRIVNGDITVDVELFDRDRETFRFGYFP
jgi:hypothetical protein